MNSNNETYERAILCLRELVKHVLNHQNGAISRITYKELATRIGLSGRMHPMSMRYPLGEMVDLLQKLSKDIGVSIPHIQSLVVSK